MVDQVLDFQGMIVLFVVVGFVLVMFVGGVWQYVVFGGQLILVLVFEEVWYFGFGVDGVDYFGIVEFDQY